MPTIGGEERAASVDLEELLGAALALALLLVVFAPYLWPVLWWVGSMLLQRNPLVP